MKTICFLHVIATTLLLVSAVRAAIPVDPAAVATLAQREAETWRRNARTHAVLVGAGENGRERINARAASAEPSLVALHKELLEQAALVLELPVLPYRTPEELAKAWYQSPYNTRQELWMGELADQLVLLSVAAAVKPEAAVLRNRIRELATALCRFPHWGAEEPGVRKANQDLAAGHAARALAITWTWNPDIWRDDAAASELILQTVRERVNILCDAISGGVYWAGLYQDNHNHINAAGVGICGAAFLEALPDEAPRWLAAAKLNFDEVARHFHSDGSSYEGVSYWSYSASFILQYLEGVRGIIDVEPYYAGAWLRNMSTYRLHASSPGFASTLPWGDTVARDSSGPHHILNRLAAQYRDPSAQYLAARLPFPPQRGLDVVAWNWLWHDLAVPANPPVELDGHLRDLDVVDTRSGWGAGDYQLSIKSGYTNRNHSHLDAGALAFAFGGEWLLPAPGYGTGNGNADFWDFYGKNGKSGSRWNYFSNATESHTTLLVNGRNQLSAKQSRSTVRTFLSTPRTLWTELDLGEAYADVRSIWRRVLHRRGDYILVFDDATFPVAGKLEWLLQLPSDAPVRQHEANIRGAAGSLDVTLLEPISVTLARRTPLSPHNDVPANRLKSYAAALDAPAGKSVSFRSLFIPRFPETKKTPVLKRIGNDHYEIHGDGWVDEIRATGVEANAPASVSLVRRESGKISDEFRAPSAGKNLSADVRHNPSPPPRPLPPLPVREAKRMTSVPAASRVIIEAEDFSQQLYGMTKISNRTGNFGKSLGGFGQDSSLHTIVWKVQVPVSGAWHLRIRYCAALNNTKIALLIDGAAPSADALGLSLPGTGSWIYTNNWKEHDLSNPDGSPLLLSLSAGEHEIRLTRPTSPLNLDRLELVSPTP
ncbi:hypothetical protein Ga0100231_024595 [Opitutaceae bacterium TAV4]|nr:hypothetical protein Ga0100231_024595 [Opitutaceae bacterium TAV4]RRK00960.1 hypothetical protein Ga0100230_024670 [Opitutaceae bacterium TAV3]